MTQPKIPFAYINYWEVIGNGGSEANFGTQAEADNWADWLRQSTGQTVVVRPRHLALRTNTPEKVVSVTGL